MATATASPPTAAAKSAATPAAPVRTVSWSSSSSPAKSTGSGATSKTPATLSRATTPAPQKNDIRFINFLLAQPRHEGLRILASVQDIDFCEDSEENPEETLMLEFVFDNFIYALQRGFPLSEAFSLVPVMRKMLECACAGVPRTEMLRTYRDMAKQLVATNQLKKTNLEKFSCQFLDNLLRHYRLFNFIHTKERPPFEAHMILNIRPPAPPPPLTLAKPLDVWTYENKWQEIQRREKEEELRRQAEKRRFATEHEAALRATHDAVIAAVTSAPSFKDKDTLERIIRDIAGLQMEGLVGNMQLQVTDIVETLSFKLEKTLLPRPQVLGPPPRYTLSPLPPAPRPQKEPKEPKSAQKGGTAKDAKAKPRTSSKKKR